MAIGLLFIDDMKQTTESPGLLRRLAAVAYDTVLLLAVLFVATALILPFNSGEAFTQDQIYYPVYLLLVSFVFFGWFWTHGGQTLGMRSWKLVVLSQEGQALSWRQALLRYSVALISWLVFGLGFWWVLFRPDKATWHDLVSRTYLSYRRD